MSYAADQRRFMELAGQQTDKTSYGQADRYAGHIKEEARELTDSWRDGEVIKAIDGATDLIVVALGFLISLGVDPDACWSAVHKANMRKVDGSCGPIKHRADGQIGKPHGWYGPEDELESIWRGVMRQVPSGESLGGTPEDGADAHLRDDANAA